ncbi:MAG: type IV toxin-antitoxin system AbiEi family antitoxin [Bacteroidales bacterium]
MENKTRFSIAKSDIIHCFNELGVKVFSRDDISLILSKNRAFWRLTQSLTVEKFIELMLAGTELHKHETKFPTHKIVRYSWGVIDVLDLALSLNKNGYLSHFSAISFHGLTEQVPKSIYVNVEQSIKNPPSEELKQEHIDNALLKPPRLSNNYAVFNDLRIYLLNGMHTNQLGVELNNEKNIRVTNIERTLIDITIRPEYSGGIFEVIKAFENASEIVSINKLVSYLKKLNYRYPFHQCVGFYMMASRKYRDNQLKLIHVLPMPYKFYLTHGIKKKQFSKEWNLYYPNDLEF